ncbi:MAG: 3-dehydroquinate synthase [Christensenellaceae bacterium]|jgi:3-dehydroquinate synthase|nr:3-dehydroquinate synthase [Christensenellaceae bacterium]
MGDIISVKATTEYNVYSGKNILQSIGGLARESFRTAFKLGVISDGNVAPLYADSVCQTLRTAGFTVYLIVVPSGEEAKSLKIYGDVLNKLVEYGFTRADAIIGLGGGVVGDLTGFVAATFLRGIAYANVPTTLLSIVDSSLGGKTGINLPGGKNLCGAFKQPAFVLSDYALLKTLPPAEVKSGNGEVVKYALLKGGDFYKNLLAGGNADAFLTDCIKYKADIVSEDEFETKGKRIFLNLGHTVAHALEKLSNFTIPHGNAVATGLIYAARISEHYGILSNADANAVEKYILSQGYEKNYGYSFKTLAQNALSDKKTSQDSISLVLLHGIGKPVVYKIKTAEFLALPL